MSRVALYTAMGLLMSVIIIIIHKAAALQWVQTLFINMSSTGSFHLNTLSAVPTTVKVGPLQENV